MLSVYLSCFCFSKAKNVVEAEFVQSAIEEIICAKTTGFNFLVIAKEAKKCSALLQSCT